MGHRALACVSLLACAAVAVFVAGEDVASPCAAAVSEST
jgi:hypothetical protein